MDRFYKTVRIATIPSITALVLLIILLIYDIVTPIEMITASVFLSILPIMSYPLQRFIPPFKYDGRNGQRNLAILFSVIGYVLGVTVSLITNAHRDVLLIYLVYLMSGILILVINKIFHFKASGHSCGVLGPISFLLYFQLYIPALIGAIIAVLVFISSIKTKRHTLLQLAVGAVMPIISLLGLNLILK